MMLQDTVEMFSAGFFSLLIFKSFIGRGIERVCINYLGQK